MIASPTASSSHTPVKERLHLFLVLLLLALCCLAVGVLLGENGLVEKNAHYLCLDCIGIG